MSRPDVLESVRKMLADAGIEDVTSRLGDGWAEAVTVRQAPSPAPRVHFDLSESVPLIVSVIVRREDEERAMDEAWLVHDLLRRGDLASPTGAYGLAGTTVTVPREFAWDDNGHTAWVVEATLDISR
jgi:hypothetical protein